jgi:hypothetical protein
LDPSIYNGKSINNMGKENHEKNIWANITKVIAEYNESRNL